MITTIFIINIMTATQPTIMIETSTITINPMGLIDTSITLEPIPASKQELAQVTHVRWTGLEYAHQPNQWIMKGMVANSTETAMMLSVNIRLLELKLMRDTQVWAYTWKKMSLMMLPAHSFYRFSIPGQTGGRYSMLLESKDEHIESEEMFIDPNFDRGGFRSYPFSHTEAQKRLLEFRKASELQTR